jgi:hypothetical protein
VLDALRLLILLCGGAFVLAVVLASRALPQPWRAVAAVTVVAAGMFAWYRAERPYEVRAEQLAKGQCLRCGYDLTGNVSGVCPECGSAS